ncbi:hypothetical protein ABT218_37450 [Streptomyces sp. NPDC001455]|uniref:hypothetical protein n=1 Tax=Streptomyces sp. NPDC001455 TaxID=3154518 RepID=UPI0033296C8F
MSEQVDAAEALKGSAWIEATVRVRSRWYVSYLWLFAVWQLVLVPAVLLWHGPTGALVSASASALVVMGLSLFAKRQPVIPHGYGSLPLKVIGVWAAAYVLALVLGFTVFVGSVTFAAVAALACALPASAAAWREARAV